MDEFRRSETAKLAAARAALDLVEPGMVVGLGTGSTAALFVRLLADAVRRGLDVAGVPTSEATARLALELGVTLVDPEDAERIHLTIDGADEFDPELRLIKGGGAALLREKIIADASDRMVVIADASKQVEQLGRFPLPIEVNPFAAELTRRRVLEAARLSAIQAPASAWRMTEAGRLLTDGGHFILDLACASIPDPDLLSDLLDMVPGVVEHGLFIGFADLAIVGTPDEVLFIAPASDG